MIKPILSMRIFWMWLAIIATALALLLWQGGHVGKLTAPVTAIDNLLVKDQLQLTSPVGPTVKTITSDPNGVVTEPRGSLRLRTDTGQAHIYQNTDGATAWATIATGTGGGVTVWTAGTYGVGQAVTRGPYAWMATTTTTEDPLVVEGNLGSGADWVVQSDTSPTQSGGQIILINNVGGKRTTAYRQSVNSGFLGKMLIADLSISGTADWIGFGIFDSSLAQTSTTLDQTGFYGVKIDIFNNQIVAVSNGSQVATSSYSNANSTNAGAAFSRWYLLMTQNGSNWDLTLYRDTRVSGAPLSGYSINAVPDLTPVAAITNVSRPSFTNWRWIAGAATGGSAGIFKINGAWTRNYTSGNWTALSKLPTQLSQ